jgi:hypothetical protein
VVAFGFDVGDPAGDDLRVCACFQGGAVPGEFGVAVGELCAGTDDRRAGFVGEYLLAADKTRS